MKTIQASAPAHWASYLINSDNSGISAIDEVDADKFVADNLGGTMPVSCSDNSFIARFGGLMCDMLEYTSLIPE